MIYTVEKFEDNVEELKELSILHYDEVAPYDDIELKVNWNKLINVEKNGALRFYTVRVSGQLIGYGIYFVGYSIEYSLSLQASMSNIFIHPDFRGQGLDFISWCDEQLKEEGVQVVYHHVKVKKDYGKMLERLGYEKMNIDYSRRLDT